MKTYPLFLLIILLASCAPQSGATPSPTPVTAHTPLATTTPQPSQTLEPTPVSIPVTEIPLDSCRQIVEAKVSNAGVLEVVYVDGIGILWLWSDATQTAISFPAPPDALDSTLSTDKSRIIFRRDSGENQSELWVIDADGQNEKKLAAVFYNEVMARNPNFQFAVLEYGWVPNAEKIFYGVYLSDGPDYGLSTYDNFFVVDINSRKATAMTIPSELEKFGFSPDGSQMAVLSGSELRVLNTVDGQVQFTIQASLNEPTYSPDGKYILDFIDGGVLLIDAKDGQQQIIPLKYTIISTRTEGPSFGPLPEFKWISNSTFIFSSLNLDQRFFFPIFKSDPSWTFTVWQVDLASATTDSIQTFHGTPFESRFSPDLKRLAFWKYEGTPPSQTRDLILADLTTGEILETISGGEFDAWFPDSDRYLYTSGNPYPPPGKGDPGAGDIVIKHYLGQIGKEPILVNLSVLSSGQWVDQNRMVMDCKIMRIP